MLRRPPVARYGPGLLGTAARACAVAGPMGGPTPWTDRGRHDDAQREAARQAVREHQRLGELADLRAAGVLTATEFAAAKARLLGT
ncbi:SHOCT domain-containing protein [Catellatospora bangladeshensis]|uniref:SHOCT domain-containing protein n=1 Tax=Catellatospora bangladeshensis TaxID=310355 RepID=A0A8J3JFR3_9ACTN|nr:SHOCT domain-containing protein [Catellatospora bangladeshensis]GIF79816.1 hypothetical protein Cba03nite_11650 [Catellatospora bangladeshensis]